MTKLYLEISSLGGACGKMNFEPIEKVLLTSWARHSPKDCKQFLINTGIIKIDDTIKEDLYKDHNLIISKQADSVSFRNTNTDEFKSIIDKTTEELKETRKKNNQVLTHEELNEFKIASEKYLNTAYGKNSEKYIIKNERATSGNNKMYYYHLSGDRCFGGKHDALKDGIVLEIKTRMKYSNIKKNEYDLYQLFGYLLSMNASDGKIIQQFNNQTFNSDTENEYEYGIINIEKNKEKIEIMLKELDEFFNKLEQLIYEKTMNLEDLYNAVPNCERPLCILSNNKLINKNNKFSKLLNFF